MFMSDFTPDSNLVETNIAVGPSAPPIIAIEPASAALNPNAAAPINVKKIPDCAAAPSRKLFGFAISGAKSVIVPIPKKISGGNICNFTPIYKISISPPSCKTFP